MDVEKDDLMLRMSGRAEFLRYGGEVKTPQLLDEAQAEIARLQALLERREKLLTSCMMQRDSLQAEVERLRKLTLTLSMGRHVPAMRVADKMHKQQAQATDDYMALLEQLKTARNDALEDAADVGVILEAMRDVHDMDVTLVDYAKAVSKAIKGMK